MAAKFRTDRIMIIDTETNITFARYDMSEAQKAIIDLSRLHASDLNVGRHPIHKVEIRNAFWEEDGSYSYTRNGEKIF